MGTIKIAATAASDVHVNTLQQAPARLLAFLQGAAEPAIRAQFIPLGWSEQTVEEAWALLNELRAGNVLPVSAEPDPVATAMASCEAWQATGLIRARAMLQLTHPEQAMFLFHDFVAGKGTAAVLNVATFLQRRSALDKGTERKGTRGADHAALAVIEQTGTTRDTLKKLQAMVDTVQSVSPAEAAPAVAVEAERIDVLRKDYAWVTAWSDIARTVITRRDHMIRLGIAKRRSAKGKAVVVVTPPVAAPAPPTAAPALPAAPAPANEAPQLVMAMASRTDDEHAPESRAA